jgi:hypothetical protein
MIGTDIREVIKAVVQVYATNGLFARWKVEYVPTHRDGSAFTKLMLAAGALHAYSVPWRLMGEMVRAAIADGMVRIHHGGHEVAVNPICVGQRIRVVNPHTLRA